MKITVESTTKVVTFEIGNAKVPARIWEGTTEDGTPVHCFITRIAPTIENPPEAITSKFARDLLEQKAPSRAVEAYDMRMIL